MSTFMSEARPRFEGIDAGPINHHGKGRCFPTPSDSACVADHLARRREQDRDCVTALGRKPKFPQLEDDDD